MIRYPRHDKFPGGIYCDDTGQPKEKPVLKSSWSFKKNWKAPTRAVVPTINKNREVDNTGAIPIMYTSTGTVRIDPPPPIRPTTCRSMLPETDNPEDAPYQRFGFDYNNLSLQWMIFFVIGKVSEKYLFLPYFSDFRTPLSCIRIRCCDAIAYSSPRSCSESQYSKRSVYIQ